MSTIMEDSDVVFERILHSVGDDGKFQKRFNIMFNFFLAAACTATYMNVILVLTLPDYWCYVPGREEANLTIDEWKGKYLPRANDSHGQESFSSCRMFAPDNITRINENVTYDLKTTECIYGYEYDTTWYSSTIPSSENWVCDKGLYTANIIAAAKFGEVFGCLVLGYLGDMYGRKVVYFISLSLMLVFRIITPFVTHWYYVFMVVCILATLPSTSVSQSCMVTIMEISPAEDRAFLAQVQSLGWTFGLSLLPLIYWILDDWFIFLLVTSIPLALYTFLSIFIIESPRWLLSKGRVSECLKELQKIAKVNGTTLSPHSSLLLQNSTMIPEKVYGVGSLFTKWRLAKNTCLILSLWVTCFLSYYTIVLNSTYMSGNPHLNFFLQSIAEAPSFFVGRFLGDKLGRRISGMFANIILIVAYLALVFTINDKDLEWFHISMMIIGKFASSMLYFIVSIQGLEIYPTCVRQGGNSLNITAGTVFGTLSPYLVHLGNTVDSRLPFAILIITSITGIIAEILLPETLNEHLPETLQEAKKFGKNQHYFSWPNKKSDTYMLANVKYLRKQHSEKAKAEDHD